MNNTTQAALKNIISSKLNNLKICFRKSFHNKYADQWSKEEAKINVLAQELKTGLNQGDSRRIQEAVNEWKAYLMMNANWKSERISELRLKSFLNSSDGRFYGGAMTDFMMLLQKIDDNNIATQSAPIATTNSGTSAGSGNNVNVINNQKVKNMSDLSRSDVIKLIAVSKDGLRLDGVNLSGVDLSGLNLFKTSFRRSNLRQTNFSNANLSEANFGEADISGANFSNTELYDTYLYEDSVKGMNTANFSGSNIERANTKLPI